MTIKSQLGGTGAMRSGDTAILITPDGQSDHLCGTSRALTRAELDALPGDVPMVRVMRDRK